MMAVNESIKKSNDDAMENIAGRLVILGMSMRDMERRVEGKVTGSLKRKIEFNLNKLNNILYAIDMEVRVVVKKDA